jgi:hypothetical protein
VIKKITGSFKTESEQVVIQNRFLKPLIYLGLFVVSIAFAIIISTSSLVISGAFVLLTLGLPIFILCFVYPRLGFLLSLGSSYFVIFLKRITYQYEAPFGAMIELLLYIAAIGALFRVVVKKDISFENFKNPLSVCILVWLAYHIMQAFNPSAHSLIGWMITMRDVITYMLFYFLALYSFSELRFIKFFTYFWAGLALFAALYGIYQEYAGLPDFDLRWVSSSEMRFRLNFIWGRFRKWSFMSDSANFGVFMAFSSIFTLVLILGPYTFKRKILFAFASMLMIMGMAFSGTRTAYAMIPAGLVLFVLMTINNYKTLAFAFIFMAVFAFLIAGPINNPVLNRVRSAFDEDDPSLRVRNENRKEMQPYILDHPIGGGLLTTGDSGLKYYPNHELSGFPSDSGFLKSALEIGWIGLTIQLLLYFVALAYGISCFYNCTNPEMKILLAAYISAFFAVSLANFSQVATKLPIGPLLFCIFALFTRVKILTFPAK